MVEVMKTWKRFGKGDGTRMNFELIVQTGFVCESVFNFLHPNTVFNTDQVRCIMDRQRARAILIVLMCSLCYSNSSECKHSGIGFLMKLVLYYDYVCKL